MPRQHGGPDDPDNLALACPMCNRRKGANLSAVDPATGAIVLVFNPRRDQWLTHFCWDGPEIRGVTDIGRASVGLLGMNDEQRQTLRRELQENQEV